MAEPRDIHKISKLSSDSAYELVEVFQAWSKISKMAILVFSLGPESLSRLHDALVCLGKFSDSVSFDASHDKVCRSFVWRYQTDKVHS